MSHSPQSVGNPTNSVVLLTHHRKIQTHRETETTLARPQKTGCARSLCCVPYVIWLQLNKFVLCIGHTRTHQTPTRQKYEPKNYTPIVSGQHGARISVCCVCTMRMRPCTACSMLVCHRPPTSGRSSARSPRTHTHRHRRRPRPNNKFNCGGWGAGNRLL